MRKEEEKLLKKEKKNNRYRSIKGSSITRENNLRIFATGIRYRVNHAILPLKDISSFHFFFFFFSFFLPPPSDRTDAYKFPKYFKAFMRVSSSPKREWIKYVC